MASSRSRGAQFALAIDDLLRHCPELEAVAVITFDGAPLATALPEHVEERRVAATMATLFEYAEHAASLLSRGRLTAVQLTGESGNVYTVPAGDRALLVTLVESGVAAEAVELDIRRSASHIAAILATGADQRGPTINDGRAQVLLDDDDVGELLPDINSGHRPIDDGIDALPFDDQADDPSPENGMDLPTVDEDDAWPYSGRDLGLVTDDRHDGGPA